MAHPDVAERRASVLLPAWVAVVCAYVVLRPVSNNVVLYPMLLSVVVVAGVAFWRSNRRIARELAPPAVVWFAFVVLGVAVAVLRDAESWVRVLVFFAFWPAMFMVVVLGFRRWAIRIVFWAAAVVTVVIGVLFLVGALTESGRMPFDALPGWLTAPQTLRFTVDPEGVISLSAHALPSLLWWGPMWIASLLCSRENPYLPPMWLRVLAAALAVAGALVAWRRGIVLVLVLVPVLLVVVWLLLRLRNPAVRFGSGARRRSAAVAVAAFLVLGLTAAFVVQTQLTEILTRGVRSVGTTVGIVEPVVDPSVIDVPNVPRAVLTADDDHLADALRRNEWQALSSPRDAADLVVGRGFGATVERGAVVRDMAPWQTELQYHALFYWTGVVGMLLLLALVVVSVRVLRRAFRDDPSLRGVLLVTAVGALAALGGNATNPYLQAPGHMWPVFLPFMIAAVMLRPADRVGRRRRREGHE